MDNEERNRRLDAELEWERLTQPPRWLSIAVVIIGAAALIFEVYQLIQGV